MSDGGEPHSAVFFGAVRDFWWNVDQLDLCARRIGFEGVRSVLDVGSGVGHWGRIDLVRFYLTCEQGKDSKMFRRTSPTRCR